MKQTILAILIGGMLWASCSGKKSEGTQSAGDAQPKDTVAATAKTKTILFFGNSLTAGYGLEPAQAFPSLIQQKIDSLGLPSRKGNDVRKEASPPLGRSCST